jgi:hydroxypyruvate reductase
MVATDASQRHLEKWFHGWVKSMTDAPTPLARREIVLLTHTLPQWISTEVQNEFDLRLLDLGGEVCREARAMITPGPARLGADIMEQLPALEFIAVVGSGYEGIDTAYTASRGIIVANSAIATGEDVADHTVAITLTLYSRILGLDQSVRRNEWPRPTFRRSLCELNVAIVGLGMIGLGVARRLASFGCDIRWSGPRFKESPYRYIADLGELATWADILIVTARADSSNIGMIDVALIDKLGVNGLFVNVSRGSIVDEEALITALRERRLGGAALDVFQSEPTPGERWRDVPNVVLTPHVGGYASGVRRNIQELLRANLHAFFSGHSLPDIVATRPDRTRTS